MDPRSQRSLADVLSALSHEARRYEDEGEFARGGMGSIHRVWDRDLRRSLAKKVFLGKLDLENASATDSTVDPRVARFVEEAQITGQLDHPGVVPVHEIGLDEQGQLFFTMPLVQGHTLAEVFAMAQKGEGGWTATRVLRVIVRVCEALAYAHSRGVVHRDLKPANVMVGRFGEVYVMDWGLAKVLGSEEPEEQSASPPVRTDRLEEASATPDSHLLTLEGNVLGTPAYMPPEQAQGRVADLGPRSDVYALGAILYEFLTGRPPYAPQGSDVSVHEILKGVLAGPPAPVLELNPGAPPELAAICEKAMARDPDERYGDSLELAEALSAFFERPVTQARRGLQRSKLVNATRWLLGCAYYALGAALLLVTVLIWLSTSDGTSVSLDLPLSFDIQNPSYRLEGNRPWIQGVELQKTTGHLVLQSSHWAAKLLMIAMIAVFLLFLMFVIQQARQILRTVRRGEPFALENLRRMRRMGVALLAFGVLRMAESPLIALFASEFLVTERLTIRSTIEPPYFELLGGALIFILAEIFRVGAELERREPMH